MKKILLFGAGKSSTVLIDYLIAEARENNWFIIIADVNKEQIVGKTNNSAFTEAVQTDITDDLQRSALIQQAAIVISMMPPALHFLIAKDCVEYGKNLLTASYLDASIKSLQTEIHIKKLLFIVEMGLDPGIDHMSAMRIIDDIKARSGVIISFKSHCGGLVAPENDDNPWHYKISWNPRNVVMAGKAGAAYKLAGEIKYEPYETVFSNCPQVDIDGLGSLAAYPNRDSLSYLPIYELEHTATFLRTTLRYPAFCVGWNAIVLSGLANDAAILNTEGLTFSKWSAAVVPFVNDDNKTLLRFLGLFDEVPVPSTAKTSADILQFLLETRLMMQPGDKDMVVMMHEIAYEYCGVTTKIESSLVIKGEDHLRTAMAKAVGLPLGIAAKLILNGTIQLTGIHLPTIKEIYDPVLIELEKAGICFIEKEL
ncbi:MAG: saccharopine dehydrogenase NADP-binding domain-containing protein [Ferruginibacter sp.]|nr:saccharopine dehydrogenase NADP-binding domain-containing protein [Ferruginibacter sp.]